MTIKPIIAGQVIPDMIQNLRVCRNICKNKQLQKHKKRPSVKIRTAAINIFLSKFYIIAFNSDRLTFFAIPVKIKHL